MFNSKTYSSVEIDHNLWHLITADYDIICGVKNLQMPNFMDL